MNNGYQADGCYLDIDVRRYLLFMEKRLSFIKLILWGAICIFILNGCSGKYVEEEQETLEKEAAIGQENGCGN